MLVEINKIIFKKHMYFLKIFKIF